MVGWHLKPRSMCKDLARACDRQSHGAIINQAASSVSQSDPAVNVIVLRGASRVDIRIFPTVKSVSDRSAPARASTRGHALGRDVPAHLQHGHAASVSRAAIGFTARRPSIRRAGLTASALDGLSFEGPSVAHADGARGGGRCIDRACRGAMLSRARRVCGTARRDARNMAGWRAHGKRCAAGLAVHLHVGWRRC